MKLLVAFCVAFLYCTCFAQTTQLRDSLLRALQQLPSDIQDTSRASLLRKLGDQYFNNNPDTSLLFYNESLELSHSLNDKKHEAQLLVNIGNAYSNLGDAPKALKYYSQGRQIAESIGDTVQIIRALGNAGLVYGDIKDLDKSIDYTLRELALLRRTTSKPLTLEAIALNNLGSTYLELNKLDSAEYYLKAAITASNQNASFLLGNVYGTLGDLSSKRNNIQAAKSFYYQAIDFNRSVEDFRLLSIVKFSLAKLYEKNGRADSALHYSKMSLSDARQGNILQQLLPASQYLDSFYEARNQPDSALHYYKIYVAAKDSIYSQDKVTKLLSIDFEEKQKQRDIEAAKIAAQKEYKNRVGFYVLGGILFAAITIAALMYRNVRQRNAAYRSLELQKQKTEEQKATAIKALEDLNITQNHLIQSEKMASLGELTAGIAHEIQNPLNFVNNFSEVNCELIEEVKSHLASGETKLKTEELDELLNDIADNSEKINHHGKRADAIVKGMLQHSRQTSGIKEPTDINALCDEYLRLAFHGMKAKDKVFNAEIQTDFDKTIGKINVVPQDIGRVLLNLFNNAFYEVNERLRQAQPDSDYKPITKVSTRKLNDRIEIRVEDNGKGIPSNIIDKIFQPFFTTKPTGQGTGLGLSLAYDIITKEHNGTIKVESSEDAGTTFIIQLPFV